MKVSIFYRNGRAVSYACTNLKELKEIIDRNIESDEIIEFSIIDYQENGKVTIYLPIK